MDEALASAELEASLAPFRESAARARVAALRAANAAAAGRVAELSKEIVTLGAELEGNARIAGMLDTFAGSDSKQIGATEPLWRAMFNLESALREMDPVQADRLWPALKNLWQVLPEVDERISTQQRGLVGAGAAVGLS